MSDVMAALGRIGLVPVVKIERVEDAAALGAALKRGGLPCAEVTFRTEAAVETIGRLAARGDLLVGAGTVLSPYQVDQAAAAGARFSVSPGFNPKVVHRTLEIGLYSCPGIWYTTRAPLPPACSGRRA